MDNLKTPKDWRKGQTLFNFLEWLAIIKGFDNSKNIGRMADPFHIPDNELKKLYTEFLKEQKNQPPEDLSNLDTNEI